MRSVACNTLLMPWKWILFLFFSCQISQKFVLSVCFVIFVGDKTYVNEQFFHRVTGLHLGYAYACMG